MLLINFLPMVTKVDERNKTFLTNLNIKGSMNNHKGPCDLLHDHIEEK